MLYFAIVGVAAVLVARALLAVWRGADDDDDDGAAEAEAEAGRGVAGAGASAAADPGSLADPIRRSRIIEVRSQSEFTNLQK